MLDILLRGGFTVGEEEIFQEKVFLHEARASFATGTSSAQVAYGDVLESDADYEIHFQRLTDHLTHCEKSDTKRRALGRPNERTLEEDLERNQSRWFKEAFDHHATELGEFLETEKRQPQATS